MNARALLFIALISFDGLAAVTPWYQFKGLYVGLKSEQIKKMGFNCQPPEPRFQNLYQALCRIDGKDGRFSTIGAVPITTLTVTLDNNKVRRFIIETPGVFWDELSAAMKKNYGAPKKSESLGTSLLWDRGGMEFISATVYKGKVEILFSWDDFDNRDKQRARKAVKDF